MVLDSDDFPSVNRPELLLHIVRRATLGAITIADVEQSIQSATADTHVKGQAHRYLKAARIFNFVDSVDDARFAATELGQKVTRAPSAREQTQILREAVLSNAKFFALLTAFPKQSPSTPDIESWLESHADLDDTSRRRQALSISRFIDEWYTPSRQIAAHQPPKWNYIRATSNAPLPDWAYFILQLGYNSARASLNSPTRWQVITSPHRNMVAALYGLGYLEGSLQSILDSVDDFEISDLEIDHPITWRDTHHQIHHGRFLGINPTPNNTMGITFKHQVTKAGGLGGMTLRVMNKAREFNFSAFFGKSFVHARPMSRNIAFCQEFFGSRYFDLLCTSHRVICFVGRPPLRQDLTSTEYKINGTKGALDDLLRAQGIDDTHEVPHFLSVYTSPDLDEEEVSARCAIFDGQRSFRDRRTYVSARDNLVVLDRWDNESVTASNILISTLADTGATPSFSPPGLKVPQGFEYIEWSRPQ